MFAAAKYGAAQPYITLYEGPTYDGTTGYRTPSFNHGIVYEPEASWALLNNAGTATWTAIKQPGGERRAMRWNRGRARQSRRRFWRPCGAMG